ncbi:nuclear transcription factor Y subunit gamma isoform X4 [Pleurodeles waltl]|uniref:nuclear transcription factor Y subunit gamma isoform X4 n=1 Tax=Pleurodeles waltl TaxID=8319 RepID=UPI003709724A
MMALIILHHGDFMYISIYWSYCEVSVHLFASKAHTILVKLTSVCQRGPLIGTVTSDGVVWSRAIVTSTWSIGKKIFCLVLAHGRIHKRNDIAMAITKFDQFDFLIDIVPRDELKPPKRQEEVRQAVTPAEPVQYYFTLAQQPTTVQVQGQQQGQQTTTTGSTIQPGQIIIAQSPQGQGTPMTMQVGEGQQVQIVQAQPQGQQSQGGGQTMQVMQQIITNTGEIQQIPVQLNTGQLQYIRLAQPVSGTQVVQGQLQALTASAQQITQAEVQSGQQQFSQFTDGQQLYQIQQVTMPAGQEITQPMFIQSTQTADGQTTQGE